MPPKGAYSLDFDDPNCNPFESKKAMQNSPPSSPAPPKGAYSMDMDKFDDPNFNPFESKKAMQNSPPASPTPKSETAKRSENEIKQDEISNELEPPKKKPPVLGKNRKPVKKKMVKKPALPKPEVEKEPEEPPPAPKAGYSMDFDKFDDPNFNPFESKKAMRNSPPPSDDLPLPKTGGYTMDFDKFDDPNFNPFESKKAMSNSPTPQVEGRK